MWTVMSALVAAASVLASARRLAWAVLPTWLDPLLLAAALPEKRGGDWTKLRDAVAACEGATWERELFAALAVADARSRVALVNEQLRELDWRARRWASVPRVCARVATSAGFLFACVALLGGLVSPTGDVGAALVSAMNALTIGIAGMSFCVAVHVRARRVVNERLAVTERFVERLEAHAAAS